VGAAPRRCRLPTHGCFSGQIPAFTPLLRLVAARLGSLTDVLVVADALHARPDTPSTCPPPAGI
ncbi:hypothetical protein, partial [Micromonospora sp. LOL_015]|uniref:hypothetical protein n=1 Tax=Micromonospora sp. LOL_015 TaxID=3345416 RepID=UPI003A8C159F